MILSSSMGDLPMTEQRDIASEAAVMSLAVRVMGGCEGATFWMLKRCPHLQNKRPVDLVQTAEGRQRITDHLHRVDAGFPV